MRNSLRMMQEPILQRRKWLQHFMNLIDKQVCVCDVEQLLLVLDTASHSQPQKAQVPRN